MNIIKINDKSTCVMLGNEPTQVNFGPLSKGNIKPDGNWMLQLTQGDESLFFVGTPRQITDLRGAVFFGNPQNPVVATIMETLR